jgi:hypothetical protein
VHIMFSVSCDISSSFHSSLHHHHSSAIGVKYKLWSPLLYRLHFPVISLHLDPSTLFFHHSGRPSYKHKKHSAWYLQELSMPVALWKKLIC